MKGENVTIFDVAKYILHVMGSMTTMKLQKLCYYCQAWSLAWDDVPLFSEDFQAWANGPVCPELYSIHRGFFMIDEKQLSKGKLSVFSNSQQETINAVLDYYGGKEPHWLSQLTHMEKPWRIAREGCEPGMNCSNVISKESMQEYYSGLK